MNNPYDEDDESYEYEFNLYDSEEENSTDNQLNENQLYADFLNLAYYYNLFILEPKDEKKQNQDSFKKLQISVKNNEDRFTSSIFKIHNKLASIDANFYKIENQLIDLSIRMNTDKLGMERNFRSISSTITKINNIFRIELEYFLHKLTDLTKDIDIIDTNNKKTMNQVTTLGTSFGVFQKDVADRLTKMGEGLYSANIKEIEELKKYIVTTNKKVTDTFEKIEKILDK